VVTDQNGCRDTSIRNNFVSIMTPRANFTVSDTMGTCPPLIVNFTNNSVNSSSVLWNFGDGSSTSTDNPSHFYSYAGTFPAQLTVTGPGGCTATQTINIVVHGPNGTFQYGGLTGCVPMTVNFSATTVNTSTFIWDFSDGNTFTTSTPSAHHSYTVTGSFLPKMILRDSAGCTVPIMGRDTIKTYGIDCAVSFNSQTICDRGNVQFNNIVNTNDLVTSYSWNFGDGQSSPIMSPNHHYDTTGLYFPMMIAQSAHGCTDTVRSTVPIKIVSTPSPEIIQTANGCVNLTVRFHGNLTTNDTSAVIWNWSFGNGNTSNAITPQAQHYATAGIYPITLTATNSSGCVGTDTSSVEAYAIPQVDAGADTLMCKGRGTTLHASGATSYSWSPATALSCINCISPVANPSATITYKVIGRTIHGCSNSDSVKIYVKNPFQMVTSPKDSLCLGSSIRMTASGANSYVWTPSTGLDNDHISSPTASPSASTVYRVIGTDDKHCFQDTAYIPVIVHQIPTVEAGEDKTINVGQSVSLTPIVSEDVNRVLWSPTGSIFMSAPPSITVKPNQTTTYTVQVFNRGGCTATDQVTINVLCDGANLFIPNTFSPNNDGMNDLFYPRGTGIFTIKRIKIFSRWGEIVFEKNNFTANDPSKAWDGTFKGMKLNPDVYVYVVDVVCDNDAVLTFKGNVALIR